MQTWKKGGANEAGRARESFERAASRDARFGLARYNAAVLLEREGKVVARAPVERRPLDRFAPGALRRGEVGRRPALGEPVDRVVRGERAVEVEPHDGARGPGDDGAVAVLGVDRTTLTANLKPLERDGLVASAIDPTDRRGRRLMLTAMGMKKLKAALPIWTQFMKNATAGRASSSFDVPDGISFAQRFASS